MSVKRLATVAVSCVAAAVLLAVAAWIALGRSGDGPPDAAVQIIPPTEEVVEGTPPATAQSTQVGLDGTVSAATEIAVYITGAVVNPGVYSATSDQRLHDVLTLAGGPTDDADLGRINLASRLTDAAHYKIPSVDDTEPEVPPPGGEQVAVSETLPTANPCMVPININAATAECLETLPGIGKVRAESIVAHREQMGPFVIAEDIKAVSGIGDGIYQRIADMIAVDDR